MVLVIRISALATKSPILTNNETSTEKIHDDTEDRSGDDRNDERSTCGVSSQHTSATETVLYEFGADGLEGRPDSSVDELGCDNKPVKEGEAQQRATLEGLFSLEFQCIFLVEDVLAT